MAMKNRQIRVADPLWLKACRKADGQGRSIAEVIRNFLVEWTKDEPEVTAP